MTRAAAAVAYQADRLGFLLEAARRHGPVVELWPGHIMVTGAPEADIIFRRTNRDFFNDRNFLLRQQDLLPGSAALDSWLRQRRAALAAMTPGMLARHAQWLTGPADELAQSWLRRGRVGAIAADLERLCSRSIARFSFGDAGAGNAGPGDVGAGGGVPDTARRMLDALFPLFASPFVFPRYIRAMQPREWRVKLRLRDLRQALRAALARRGPDSLAEVLLDAGLTEAQAIGMLTSVHLAAHGVPAAALAWALVELARDPEQQQAAAAAAAQWDDDAPVPARIGWVVDEALRLWPPSWLSDRVTVQPAPCGDWVLPGRSRLLLPFWVIHRVADCYAEPDRFDSGRWRTLKPSAGAYLPFGAGPHRCLGARFARMELTVVLAMLLRRVRLTLTGEVRPDARRTLTPDGFVLGVAAR